MNIKKNNENLLKLLCFLFENNPFYKEVFRKIDMNPYINDIIDVFTALPYITKQDIIKSQGTYYTKNISDEIISKVVTSGTSGDVLTCYKTIKESSSLALQLWRQRRKIDNHLTPENFISLFSDETEILIGKFYNTKKNLLVENFEKIISLNPRWLSGPISIIEQFAKLIYQEEIIYEKKNLEYIEFMGEFVDEKKRSFIENIFNVYTVNNYGTQETWCIAYDCKDKHLHLLENCILVEIINPDEEGYGEIILTSLINYYMPFIKYKIGDLGRMVDSNGMCGNNSPIIELKQGRKSDFITGKNILGNYFFDQVIWDVNDKYPNSIFAFSVIQKDIDMFSFRIVKGINFNDEIITTINQRLKSELGRKIETSFDFVEYINYGNTGKLKKFISFIEFRKNKK